MKEIYGWVPWFRELAQKIATNENDFLVERAKRIAWNPSGDLPPLLKHGDENIDPFSFFYSIAGRSGWGMTATRIRIYRSISEEFDIADLENLDRDEAFIFPTPPLVTALFHDGQHYFPDLLWDLFRDAVSGVESMHPENFDRALKISGVAISKLTQALFLVNPEEFPPFDKRTLWLGISTLDKPERVA